MEPIMLHVHRYACEVGSDEYRAIQDEAKARGFTLFRVIRTDPIGIGTKEPRDGEPLELDPSFLFDNQYNAGEYRVFDWHESYYPGDRKTWRAGYILRGDLDALEALKREQYKCGFCGYRHQGHDAPMVCPKCLGSKYLEETDLHLTILQPIIGPKRGPENAPTAEAYEAARAEARERFKVEQAARREALAAKKVEEAEADAARYRENKIRRATMEAAILRAGVDDGKLIQYTHAGRKAEFVFGWADHARATREESEALRSADLPYDVKIIHQDGTTA